MARKKENSNQLALDLNVSDGQKGYTTLQVVEIIGNGVSRRMVDHWTEEGIIRASIAEGKGSGSSRYYSYQDLLEINLARKLRDIGMSLEKIRENFAYVRNDLKTSVYKSVLILADDQPAVVVGENELYTLASSMTKTDTGQGIMHLNVINLSRIKLEVDKKIENPELQLASPR